MQQPATERIVALLISAMILWMIWGNTYWEAETRDWPSVKAKVFASEVKHTVFFYRSSIAYYFTLNGREYYGNRVTSGPLSRMELRREEAQQFLDRYPNGTEVTVYYDPRDPKRSSMALPSTWDSVEMIVQMAIFFLAMWLIGYGIRRRPYEIENMERDEARSSE